MRGRHERRQHHGHAEPGEDHHDVGVAGVDVVRLLAVAQSAQQRRHAQQRVDVQHDRRIDRVARERGRGRLVHDDREDHDLHQHGAERQHHRAVGLAQALGERLGVVGDAHRREQDGRDQHDGGGQRRGLPRADDGVCQRPGDAQRDGRDQQRPLAAEERRHSGSIQDWRAPIIGARRVPGVSVWRAGHRPRRREIVPDRDRPRRHRDRENTASRRTSSRQQCPRNIRFLTRWRAGSDSIELRTSRDARSPKTPEVMFRGEILSGRRMRPFFRPDETALASPWPCRIAISPSLARRGAGRWMRALWRLSARAMRRCSPARNVAIGTGARLARIHMRLAALQPGRFMVRQAAVLDAGVDALSAG